MTTPTPPPLTDADIHRRIETAERIIEERDVEDDEALVLLAHDYLHTLRAFQAERAASRAAEERLDAVGRILCPKDWTRDVDLAERALSLVRGHAAGWDEVMALRDDRYAVGGLDEREYVGPREVPWSLLEPHERQALRNHSQTLERLAERGGLSPCEMVHIIEGREWDYGKHDAVTCGCVEKLEAARAVAAERAVGR